MSPIAGHQTGHERDGADTPVLIIQHLSAHVIAGSSNTVGSDRVTRDCYHGDLSRMRGPRHFLTPLLDGRTAGVSLIIERTSGVLAGHVEPAFTSKARNRGLLGRDALTPDTALVIAPSNSIHTFFMRFPIDIIYTDREGGVLKIRSAVKPWRISGCLGAFAAIEMGAGSAGLADLRVGDRLTCVARQT